MSARVHLTRRLVLETPERVADGAGGYAQSWVSLGTLWADIDARTGRAASGEDTSLSRTGYRVTVRAAPSGAPSRPVPGQRFRDGSRVFRIEAVAERDVQARYLTCFCQEEVAR
ncbi:MAG: head-tail adaptor protein [Rhodobacteraceae bacterium]|jgi:head-tail adaptor|nr:head-tail adaptor protein [Paracoccaceae bacterium]